MVPRRRYRSENKAVKSGDAGSAVRRCGVANEALSWARRDVPTVRWVPRPCIDVCVIIFSCSKAFRT